MGHMPRGSPLTLLHSPFTAWVSYSTVFIASDNALVFFLKIFVSVRKDARRAVKEEEWKTGNRPGFGRRHSGVQGYIC